MYSRIPMPRMDWTEERMRYALCFFPLIGAVIGAVEAILKDPHTGAFAIIGLGLYLLLYAGAVSELVGADVWLLPGALMLERACSGYSVVAFPKAKKDGLAAEFSRSAETKVVRVSMAVLAVLAISWMIYWGHLRGACNLCLLLSFFHAGIWRHQRRSGRAFSAELRAECAAGAGGDAAGRYVPAIFEFLSEEKQNDFYNWRQGTRKDSVCDEIVGKTYFGTEENKRLIHRSESIEKSRSV